MRRERILSGLFVAALALAVGVSLEDRDASAAVAPDAAIALAPGGPAAPTRTNDLVPRAPTAGSARSSASATSSVAPGAAADGALALARAAGWSADDRRIAQLEEWLVAAPDLEAALGAVDGRAAAIALYNDASRTWRAALEARFGPGDAARIAAAWPLYRIDVDSGEPLRVGADGERMAFDPRVLMGD